MQLTDLFEHLVDLRKSAENPIETHVYNRMLEYLVLFSYSIIEINENIINEIVGAVLAENNEELWDSFILYKNKGKYHKIYQQIKIGSSYSKKKAELAKKYKNYNLEILCDSIKSDDNFRQMKFINIKTTNKIANSYINTLNDEDLYTLYNSILESFNSYISYKKNVNYYHLQKLLNEYITLTNKRKKAI